MYDISEDIIKIADLYQKNDAEVVDDYRRLETMVQRSYINKKQYHNLSPKNVHDETCSLLRNAYFAEEIIGEK